MINIFSKVHMHLGLGYKVRILDKDPHSFLLIKVNYDHKIKSWFPSLEIMIKFVKKTVEHQHMHV